MTARPHDPVESLRNTRRSLGGGDLAGRARIATPYRPDRLRRAVSAVSSSSTLPVGETLALTGTATTGTAVLAGLDTIQAQRGFDAVDAASDTVTLPATASWLAEVDVRFTDGYRGGGTVQVTLDGTALAEAWPTSGPWGRWVDQVAFIGRRTDVVELSVVADDAASHPIEVTFRICLVERLKAELPNYNVLTGAYFLVADASLSETYLRRVDEGAETFTDFAVPSQKGWTTGANAISGCLTNFDRGELFIGYEDGTLYRSTTVPPNVPSDYSLVYSGGASNEIREIVSNGSVIMAIEDSSDLIISTDGGATWSDVGGPWAGTPDANAHLSLSFDGTRWLFGLTANSDDQWYSDDDGTTWTNLATLPSSTTDVEASAYASTGWVFAKTESGVHAYASDDDGATFASVDLGLGSTSSRGTADAMYDQTGRQYLFTQGFQKVATGDYAVFRHDGDTTFTEITAVAGGLTSQVFQTHHFLEGVTGRMYKAEDADGYLYSDDDGDTWTEVMWFSGQLRSINACFGLNALGTF